MSLNQLTCKELFMKAKNGKTLRDLCEKYECTEEALEQRIAQLFNSRDGARAILKQLEGNSKRVANCQPDQNTTGESLAKTMRRLQRLEKKYDRALSALEDEYESYAERRRKCDEELAKIYPERQWPEADMVVNGIMEQLITEDRTLVSSMNKIAAIHKKNLIRLNDLYREIEELGKITVCVYADGEISPFDESIQIIFDDTGSDKIVDKMQNQVEANMFCQEDLKTVARVIAIATNLGPFLQEIVFEDSKTEDVYMAFVGIV